MDAPLSCAHVRAEVLRAARAMEPQGWLPPKRWVDLAVVLLLNGFDDAEEAELAGLPANISGWVTEPLIQRLYDAYAVSTDVSADAAVETIAALLAADLSLDRRPQLAAAKRGARNRPASPRRSWTGGRCRTRSCRGMRRARIDHRSTC